jgi:phosphoglycolate phosphatase-like HAD superfamily hydrolase
MAKIVALFDATLGHEAMGWFEAIGAAEQAPVKKPDPSVYNWVLEQLDLPGAECIAIEDTRNGVLAARGAGVPVVVTQSFYSAGEDFSGALAVVSDLGEPDAPYEGLGGPATADSGWVTPDTLGRWLEGSRKQPVT